MKRIGVGILGFGTVGAGVAQGLLNNNTQLAERTGIKLELRKIADLNIATDRGVDLPGGLLTTDALSVINDPDINVIVELIGGSGIAREFVIASIEAGKSVVTANKKLLAEHGREIFDLALEKGVDVFFGASVGGGIPIIRSLRDGLSANRIEAIHGILNGTCNYILSGMEKDGLTFEEALAKAQKLGFAEADPTLDVDGFDTLHKAAILSSIAYGISPDIDSLPVQGIRDELDAEDIRYAAELGYRIKLLAIIKGSDDEVEIRVAPTLIPESSMLASVNGVFNGVLVKGDLSDATMYYGRGAGRLPTASTVIGDIAEAARAIVSGSAGRISVPKTEKRLCIKAIGEVISRHYVRLSLHDAAGSLAAAAGIFGKHGVSISVAMQKGDPCEDGYATVIVLTHMIERAKIDAAISEISALECCGARPRLLGIED